MCGSSFGGLGALPPGIKTYASVWGLGAGCVDLDLAGWGVMVGRVRVLRARPYQESIGVLEPFMDHSAILVYDVVREGDKVRINILYPYVEFDLDPAGLVVRLDSYGIVIDARLVPVFLPDGMEAIVAEDDVGLTVLIRWIGCVVASAM
ncbi:MAG: hypothetical protein QXI22_09700 [Sulfolobales archaeon]|jgi:hypothetical protein